MTSVIHDMFSFSLYILLAEKHLPEVKKKNQIILVERQKERKENDYICKHMQTKP